MAPASRSTAAAGDRSASRGASAQGALPRRARADSTVISTPLPSRPTGTCKTGTCKIGVCKRGASGEGLIWETLAAMAHRSPLQRQDIQHRGMQDGTATDRRVRRIPSRNLRGIARSTACGGPGSAVPAQPARRRPHRPILQDQAREVRPARSPYPQAGPLGPGCWPGCALPRR